MIPIRGASARVCQNRLGGTFRGAFRGLTGLLFVAAASHNPNPAEARSKNPSPPDGG